MESVIYRFTLDCRKSGIQNTLQGFSTGDGLVRKLNISLTNGTSTFAIDEAHSEAMMYVLDPITKVVSINDCEIKDNSVLYTVKKTDVRNSGLVQMQLKLIQTHPTTGVRRVLAAPKFSIEVDSATDIDSEIAEELAKGTFEGSFTALEKAVAKAQAFYHARLVQVEFDEEFTFHAYYADGAEYVNDEFDEMYALTKEALETSTVNAELTKQYAEAVERSTAIARSAELGAKEAQRIAEDAANHALVQAAKAEFSMNFDTGNVEYQSDDYVWRINEETGDLEYQREGDEE